MTWTITVEGEVQSGNALAYSHWSKRTKDRKAWAWRLRKALDSQPIPPATGRRQVVVTAYRKRRLDDDNLSSGLKHFRDCLVRAGLLIDDNAAGAAFSYYQNTVRFSPTGAPCLVVTISEIA